MIGILYPRSLLSRLMKGKPSFEYPAFYVEAAKKAGTEVIFFSEENISWRQGTVRGWNGKDPARTRRPIPRVIINRTRTDQWGTKHIIRKLKKTGSTIFNEHNVYSKLDIHRILSQNTELLPYLPVTDRVTHDSVSEMLKLYSMLYLKPQTASVGNGIIRLRKKEGSTVAEINSLGYVRQKTVGTRKIVKHIRGQKRDYLVQQGIRLMKYNERSVDFRVSVQKDGQGAWQCTGIVGRVGRKGSVVTNLHCGGQAKKARELFEYWGWDVMEMEGKISHIGIQIAQTLEQSLPGIADLGLDIAVDEQQRIWFIEANMRDLRITFRDAGEMEKWRATFATPVQYAAYLLQAAGTETHVS